jgi:hypothetical protein
MRDTEYKPGHEQEYEAAIFWGYVETCQAIMKGYTEAGKAAVYLDLAYWHRDTHYKVAVGARHPTVYFQRRRHPADRRQFFGVVPKAYKQQPKDAPILFAGLSQKAAWAENEGPWGQYEARAIASIRRYTTRPIIYRTKVRGTAKPIPGTIHSDLTKLLQPLLEKAHCVVTRHSNVAVDGLVEGIPCFAWHGVGSVMGLQDVSKIETPYYPEDREQWLNDVAYCQWSMDEMKDGSCWHHLKNEGLVK